MYLTRCFLLAALLAPVALVGCSNTPAVELVEVEGTITVGDQPLDGVRVVFSPDHEKGNIGVSSQAMTDANGKFVLKYKGEGGGQGAQVGWHRITVFDLKVEDARDNPIPERISMNYRKPSKTELTVEVKPVGDGEKMTHDFAVNPIQ